jgi:excisionase family DNA binding protein
MDAKEDPLVRIPIIARLLDVPESTVYGLVRRKLLPAVKVGRHIRFSEPRVREFIERGGTVAKDGQRFRRKT